jgi:hypothetical protein
MLGAGDAAGGARRASVVPLSVADPATHWARARFAEMTPPIRLPSRDGKERISVRLFVPDEGRIGVVRRGARASLVYPPGTIADRVDMRDFRDQGSIQDVRGTRFAEGGEEYFHVLRPLVHGQLDGVEWPRSDVRAWRAATDEMLGRMASTHPPGPAATALLSRFELTNDCAGCHAHDKPERHQRALAGVDGEPAPNRATDAGGLYAIATVLEDSAPLEQHRPLDMNEGDPYVSVTCDDGAVARLEVTRRGARRHYACADGSVPRARLDLVRALADGDAHAEAVCASRAYLQEHMDVEARAAFAPAFAECSGPERMDP